MCQIYGILLALLAGGFHFLLRNFFPQFAEFFYFSKLYVGIKWVLWPIHYSPVPALYLFTLALLVVFGFGMYQLVRKRFSILVAIRKLLNGLGLLFFLFYFSWGYNYSLPALVQRLGWNTPSYTSDHLLRLYHSTTDQALRAREAWRSDSDYTEEVDISSVENELELELTDWLRENDLYIPVPSKVRSLPPGFLLRISTAGFYFPFGGEGYWDEGLHHLVMPFVMAHEMAHNFGITNEGEANFVAFHTCIRSTDPKIRYSGYLNFWRYVASHLRQFETEKYESLKEIIPPGILIDLESIQIQHAKYPDIFPAIRDAIYNSYLKSQGVQSGLRSYGEVVQLELAYRMQFEAHY